VELGRLDAAVSSRSTLTAANVRTELAVELGRIDATISSRSSGTIPTAAQVATQVRSELGAELGRIDVAISSRAETTAIESLASDLVNVDSVVRTTDSNVGSLLLDSSDARIILEKLNFMVDMYPVGSEFYGFYHFTAEALKFAPPVTAEAIREAVGLDSANLSTVLDEILEGTGTIDSTASAIRTQTDRLTFGIGDALDANISHVNRTPVEGDGHEGTEWGPA
jgi:hypothetical protein